MTRLINGVLCIMCLVLSACSVQTGMRESLDKSVKEYNRLLRWHEIEQAVMTYNDPEERERSLKQAESLKKRGLSVTDFRILTTKFVPESKSGDVMAEFDYYILPSNRVKTASHRQAWVYLEESRSWRVKGGLPLFE